MSTQYQAATSDPQDYLPEKEWANMGGFNFGDLGGSDPGFGGGLGGGIPGLGVSGGDPGLTRLVQQIRANAAANSGNNLTSSTTGGATGGVGGLDYGTLLQILLPALFGAGGALAGGLGGSNGPLGSGGGGTPNTRNPTGGKPTQPAATAATGGLLGVLSKALGGGAGLTQALGLVSSLGGTLLQSNALGNATGMLQNMANSYGQLGKQGLDSANPLLGEAANTARGVADGSNGYMQLINNALIPNVKSINDALPGLFGQNLATDSAQGQGAVNNLSGTANNGGFGLSQMAALQNIMNGGGTAQTGAQKGFLGNFEQGNTPTMQSLANGSTAALSSGGMTPQLASALAQTQALLANGGGTGTTAALQGKGMDLVNQSQLAPMSLVLSMAQNDAATKQAQAAQYQREQALARGGGPGSVLGNGIANRAMEDNAEGAQQNIAQNVQQALLGRQGLDMQQLNSGSQMAQGGASLDAQRLGELLNSTSNLTQTATGRMGVGGSLANDYNSAGLQSGSLLNAMLGLEMGNQVSNMGAFGNSAGTQGSLQSNLLQQLLAGRTAGAQAGNAQGGLYLQNNGQFGNMLNNALGQQFNAANLLGGQGSNWLNFGGNMYGNAGPVITSESQFAQKSPFGNLLNTLGGAASINPNTGQVPATNNPITNQLGGGKP